MKVDSHKLGYPNKVSYLSTGGSSTDVFEEMIEIADNNNIKIIDAIIDSLPKLQKQSIFARFLKEKKPIMYEKNLELAMDNLLTMAAQRID